MITPQQIRAGRAMLGLSQKELAQKAHISVGTLNNIERGVQTDPKISTLKTIQNTLEAEGIVFSSTTEGGMGLSWMPRRPNAKHATILVIDDSAGDRALYRSWLLKEKTCEYTIIEASHAKEGYESYLQRQPDCIVLDFKMYGVDGFQLLVKMKRENATIPPIVFVTAMSSPEVEKNVREHGIHAYLDKNTLTQEHFRTVIANAVR